ncbi:hypothetical protein AURDEDRAFT_166330 [Auricularia subglabra TFB-10046 SS5]|uniref:C2H2-type domain-containing protein n=1 Tax=Auricularia subglabra (strain TFB-10046 / SS5) TaxID=717982 RepID=J0DDL5_AURST|nr:hypothetical protein AURDEDRAFT_166330 [Auricularia subglabra TFB-10046 SS5]
MSAPVDAFRCLWRGCPVPGPYTTDKALFEHVHALHNVAQADDAEYMCQWAGCMCTTASRKTRTQHLSRHTEYRPYTCTHSGCGETYACSQDLSSHCARHGVALSSEDECRCNWADCGRVFADATKLRAHLEQTHAWILKRGVHCGWTGCVHVFAGGNYKAHLSTHLPAWYKPFACPLCERAFTTAHGLARHGATAHSAPTGDSDDYTSDYEPIPLNKRAPLTARGARQVAKPYSGAYLHERAADGSRQHSPPQVKVNLILTADKPAKRARIHPLPPPRAPDDSESELDIVITTADLPEIAYTDECSVEIASAMAEIVDSPVWAIAARGSKTQPEMPAAKVRTEVDTDR